MLGQPVSMLIPKVVGFKLSGAIPTGVTATDVVLTITEMLRKHGVVGKFVEFYGSGVASVPLANRATIGNMSPEFGSTAAMFPIDDVTHRLPAPHRPQRRAARARRGVRQGAEALARRRRASPSFTEYLELDLATVVPSIAGPKRPQDRIVLSRTRRRSSSPTSRTTPRSTTTSSTSRVRSPSPRPTRPATRPRTSTASTSTTTTATRPRRRRSRRRWPSPMARSSRSTTARSRSRRSRRARTRRTRRSCSRRACSPATR